MSLTRGRAVRKIKPVTSTKKHDVLKRSRYAHLIGLGCSVKETLAAYNHPERYAKEVRRLGGDPKPKLAERGQSGWPRSKAPIAMRNRDFYYRLKVLGVCASFASEFCKSPYKFARALRILSGEEAE